MTDRKLTEQNRDVQEARLERLIHGVLRGQAALRAPASLEARVLGSIQQQSLPWWRTGFLQWPMAARVALFAALLLITKLTLDLVMWLFTSPTPVALTVESSVTWAKSTASMFTSLLLLCQSLFNVIPPHWITLGLGFAASMYVMLFVLGATAYRTLYLNK
jgi:hypothetical protein